MPDAWSAHERRALFRFSLYGFLKNQRYFEAFLVLAFLDKGLSFFEIGLLVGFGSLCTNLLEIPSGALADLHGRRRAMILSFAAYTAAYIGLAAGHSLPPLFLAMFFFGLGEAFRSGTHKAMIFNWLQAGGREDDRVELYGFTRSWSKKGSALSALVAGLLVFVVRDFDIVFWLSVPPCILNIINFLGYPDVVEGGDTRGGAARRPRGMARHVLATAREAWRNRAQRRLILEATGFEGVFKVCKDYLQPVVQQAALAAPLFLALEDTQRTAVFVAAIYTVLFLLSSTASRHSHTLVKRLGGDEERAARVLWGLALVSYAAMLIGLFLDWRLAVIPAFVVVFVVQNLWRPALVSRLDACSDNESGATLLSIESQSRSLFAMIAAPLLGLAVDHAGLWPVGLLGAVVAVAALALGRAR